MSDGVPLYRILAVDDEPAILAVLGLALEHEGFALLSVGAGEDALAAFEKSRFDLLITDKNLPFMSGLEVIREVRARDAEIPIILITGYGSVDSAVDSLNLGIDAYIEKPFSDVTALGTLARKLIERRRDSRRNLAGQPFGQRNLSVLLACPPPRRRERLATGLGLREQDRLIGAGVGAEIVETMRRERAEVVIVDGGSYHPDVTAVVGELRDAGPEVACIVLSEKNTLPEVRALIGLGVRALVDIPPDDPRFTPRMVSIFEKLRGADQKSTP